MKMTRRQFLKSIGAAAAAPAVAKMDWLDDATGHGWSVVDMGDYLILRIRDNVTVADQHFGKPVIVEGGRWWTLTRTRIDGPVNIQTGTDFLFTQSVAYVGDAPAAVTFGGGCERGVMTDCTFHRDSQSGVYLQGHTLTVHSPEGVA